MADTARLRLSDWKFWMGVAYFMLVWVSVATLVDYTHASHAISKTQRLVIEHNAEQAAARQARVQQCFAQIPLSEQIDKFLDGVREFHVIVTNNNKALADATPKDSPLYTIRLRNYQRLKATIPQVSSVRFPVPTKPYCRRLK